MYKLRSILILVLIIVAAEIAVSQNTLNGKIVDIVDGKTVVMETSSGKLSVVLQYVEVPEPEQPLHQLVRDHLRALAVGKPAKFRPLGLTSANLTGQVVVDGVDLSQQMLRDGAAWLVPVERAGSSAGIYSDYIVIQDQARDDRLGVWSVPDIKPAWEFRAEKLQASKPRTGTAAAGKQQKAVRSVVSQYQTVSRPGYSPDDDLKGFNREAWLDVFAGTGTETVGLHNYSEPGGRYGGIYTSAAFVNFESGGARQRVEFRVLWVYVNMLHGGRDARYVIGFRAVSEDYKFSMRSGKLTAIADGQTITIGAPLGFRGRSVIGATEIMLYLVDKATLSKIANAGKTQLRIDSISGTIDRNTLDLIKQLLSGT
jgi:endonuclease YncB( thermonuclease family)